MKTHLGPQPGPGGQAPRASGALEPGVLLRRPAPQLSRRRFLRHGFGAGLGACAGLTVLARGVLAAADRATPNSRITVGMIGLGRQAYHANLLPFLASPDTQVVAVCDVDAWRADQGRRRVEDFYAAQTPGGSFKGCQVTGDFREVLARPDIDAVMISTPDHWHAVMAVEAARAGKDVALEKPISLSIAQGRAISDAITQHSRIFRTDTEVRFSGDFRRLCECVRNGRIGRVRRIRAEVPNEAEPIAAQPVMPVPEGLDYARWLGPAPEAPYTEKRVHARNNLSARPGWMIIHDYCDGIIGNWGTHLLDIVQWAHNSELTGPVEIEGCGAFHPAGGLSNVLGSFAVSYRYADGVELTYAMTGRPAVRFEGDDGWIEAVWNKGVEAEPKAILDAPFGPNDLRLPLLSEKLDFIQSVKRRTPTLIPAEIGHRTNTMCHLGLIAIKLGQKLEWDPQREAFVGNDAANQLRDRPLRAPWRL